MQVKFETWLSADLGFQLSSCRLILFCPIYIDVCSLMDVPDRSGEGCCGDFFHIKEMKFSHRGFFMKMIKDWNYLSKLSKKIVFV